MYRSLVGLLLLQALVVLQVSAVAHMVCPDNWELLGQRCYLSDLRALCSFDKANPNCLAMGGMLLVQETQEEINLLRAFLDSKYIRGEQFWIGLRKQAPALNFTWMNGAPMLHQDWVANAKDDANATCVRYRRRNSVESYGWDATECANAFGFICEMNATEKTELSFRASANLTAGGVVGLRVEQQVSGVALHTDCLRACIRVPACESLAYNPASRQCRMLSHNTNGEQHEDEDGWKTFFINL